MKIVAIGDTHGRLTWKEIVNKNDNADKIIFIGDYFDTHDNISPEQQISNFKDIIAFKKSNMEKVILLTGNHDFHYIPSIGEQYSGYQWHHAKEIGELVAKAIEEGLLQMCWMDENYFFSHAGLTKTWFDSHFRPKKPNLETLVEDINELFKTKPTAFHFMYGERLSSSGDDITQSPIWVRPRSLIVDMVDGIICVVGHTPVQRLVINPEFPQIIMIDTMGTTREYLIFENKVPRVVR